MSSGLLIINFAGLGNGFVALPILRCLEVGMPSVEIHHVDNEALRTGLLTSNAGVSHFGEFAPLKWRRFGAEDWVTIKSFAEENKVQLIINFRNEGITYDKNYFDFKSRFRGEFEFWDLFEDGQVHEVRWKQLLPQSILDMLKSHGIDTSLYDPQWLAPARQRCSSTDRIRVAFCVGASQPGKRWRVENWFRLGRSLLALADYEIRIFSGVSGLEKASAIELFEMLGTRTRTAVHLMPMMALAEFVKALGEQDIVVANDSFPLHAAAALGIPSIGLYFGTDSAIWGANSPVALALQSQIGVRCQYQRPAAGNCERYYAGCGGCGNQLDVIPESVLALIRSIPT